MYKKKWFKILVIIFGVFLIGGLVFHFYCVNIKKQMSKRHQNLVELPQSVDYKKMTSEQQKTLLASIGKKYAPQAAKFSVKENKEYTIPYLQEITFTQNGTSIPMGQTPPQGEVSIEPTKLSSSSSEVSSDQSSDQPPESGGSRGNENQPPDQNPPAPADQTKKKVEVGTIFIAGEDSVSDGNFGGIDGANKECQTAAEKENFTGHWMALLSSAANEIKYRLPDAVYKNVSGQVVAKDKNSLFSGKSLENPILFTNGKQMNTEEVSARVATGGDEQAIGGVFSDAKEDSCKGTCKDWTSSENTCEGVVGKPDKLYKSWWAGGKMNCTLPGFTLYCVKSEEVETIPGGPTIYYYGFARSSQQRTEVQAELYKIKANVEKYYPKIVETFGQPYDPNRNFYIIYDIEASSFINSQYGWVTLGSSDPIAVVLGLEAAFSGKYFSKIPQTWEYGNLMAGAEQIFRSMGDSRLESNLFNGIRGDVEKFNKIDYPIWGTNIFYKNDILPIGYIYRMLAASTVMNKPYIYDKEFFKKFYQKIYEIPLDSNLWSDDRKIFENIQSAFPASIEGLSPLSWYNTQTVLHQTETNPERILLMKTYGQTFIIRPSNVSNLGFYSYKSEFSDNNVSFVAKPNETIHIKIRNDKNELKVDENFQTNNLGELIIKLPDKGITESGDYTVQISLTGPVNPFDYFPFDNNNQLRGIVNNFGEGKIGAYDQNNNLIQEIEISRGAFSMAQTVGKAGIIKLKVKDYNGQQVTEREIAKDIFGYFVEFNSPVPSFPPASPGGSRSGAIDCNNLNLANWQTYDKQGFKAKYPSDWEAKKSQSNEGQTQWFVSFNPSGGQTAVWIGGSATSIEEFKNYIATEIEPGFTIEKEESATVDGKKGTKFTVQGKGQAFKSYFYHIPFMNIPYIFQGPAIESASQFQKCEPQVFQKMIQLFKFPTSPGEGEQSNVGDKNSYANADCKFTLDYPADWDLTSVEYYETPAGSKATVPTILFAKKGSTDVNQILINMHQTFCMDVSGSSKSQEATGGRTISITTYPDNTWCASAEAEGKDNTGKKATYDFVAKYNDSSVLDAFKMIVGSFKEL